MWAALLVDVSSLCRGVVNLPLWRALGHGADGRSIREQPKKPPRPAQVCTLPWLLKPLRRVPFASAVDDEQHSSDDGHDNANNDRRDNLDGRPARVRLEGGNDVEVAVGDCVVGVLRYRGGRNIAETCRWRALYAGTAEVILGPLRPRLCYRRRSSLAHIAGHFEIVRQKSTSTCLWR